MLHKPWTNLQYTHGWAKELSSRSPRAFVWTLISIVVFRLKTPLPPNRWDFFEARSPKSFELGRSVQGLEGLHDLDHKNWIHV